jgi:hypothetical protein
MKLSEIPLDAFVTAPTPIPTKVAYDWDAMYAILVHRGYVILESDRVRGHECVEVKAFNSHLRQIKKAKLKTKRIANNRWFCTL